MARQRNMAVKSGINKQGWQQSDFPIACEPCYGASPFMRMLKQRYGQQCRICFRPFTVFKWKVTKGRYKRTAICQSCAKSKNLCQTCFCDLEFGLPMQVRDRRCGQAGKELLDANFTTPETKTMKKPPPPSNPPPELIQKDNIMVLPPTTIFEQSQQSD